MITPDQKNLLKAIKVRQIWNDFFPKNERTNSFLLHVDLFSFVFWKKVKALKNILKLTDLYQFDDFVFQQASFLQIWSAKWLKLVKL